ncbi:MAG: HDOD domain-containing protein [Nitrospirota bacterium]
MKKLIQSICITGILIQTQNDTFRVQHDTLLNMFVLKAVSSALYRVRQNIDTITQAIAIMSLKSVKIITLFKNTYERISPLIKTNHREHRVF